MNPIDQEKTRFHWFEIEQYLAGELEPSRALELEARMAKEPALAAKVDGLRNTTGGFAAREVPREWYAPPARNVVRESAWLRWWKPMAAAALLAVCLLPMVAGEGEKGLAAKGSQGVELWVGKTKLPEAPAQNLVLTGDTLKLQFRSSEPITVKLRFRDDGGQWQKYFDALSLPAASEWSWAPQSVLLEAGWRLEELELTISNGNSSETRHYRMHLQGTD